MTADLHSGVPAAQWEELLEFDRRHPYRRGEVDGKGFDYVTCGVGTRTLLLLPGLLGDSKSLYQQILDFERDHRVIALSYPDTPQVRLQHAAIECVLEAEGVERVVLVGQTLGGFLAHSYARAHAARIEGLVLVHAGLPNARRGAELEREAKLARLVPYPLIRWYLQRELMRMVATLTEEGEVGSEQAQVIVAHLHHRFARLLTKERVLARYRLLADLHREAPPVPGEVPGLAGRVLLLHSEGNVFSRNREAFAALYPGIRSHSMGKRHNISLLIKPAESNRLIRELLDSLGEREL